MKILMLLLVWQAIERIAREEGAKLFVPVSIAQYSVYEAIAAERLAQRLGVRSCTASTEAVALLNDKIKFTHLCQRIGAPVPQMFPVTSADQLLDLNSRHALPPGLSYTPTFHVALLQWSQLLRLLLMVGGNRI